MLIGAALASTVSALAVKSASPMNIGLAFSCWLGCIWYFKTFRWQLTSSGVAEQGKEWSPDAVTRPMCSDVAEQGRERSPDAVTRPMWLVLLGVLFAIYWLLDAIGLLSGEGGVFAFLAFGSTALLLTAAVILIVQKICSSAKSSK
jgi:hypothetical protein